MLGSLWKLNCSSIYFQFFERIFKGVAPEYLNFLSKEMKYFEAGKQVLEVTACFRKAVFMRAIFLQVESPHTIYGMARNWLRMLGIWASFKAVQIAWFSIEGCTLLVCLISVLLE